MLHRGFDHVTGLIDVSDSEGTSEGNGHGYLRDSPWASSDILTALMSELGPTQRGLKLRTDMPVYEFPSDYVERLRTALEEAKPRLTARSVNP